MTLRPFPSVFLSSCAVALALTSWSPTARADNDDDPRRTKAEVIFAEGLRLHDKDRDAEAIEKYRQAYAIYPTANALFAIARIEHVLGQRLSALRHYREALRDPLLHVSNQELGKKYVPALERELVRVDVSAPPGTIFTIDGKRFVTPLDEPIDFEPGTITLEGSYGDKRYIGSVVGAKGSHVKLLLTPESSSATAPSDLPAPETTTRESFWGFRSITGLVLVAAGAGGLIAGVAFKSEKASEQSKMNDLASALPSGEANSSCFGSNSAACSQFSEARRSRDEAANRASTWLPLGIGTAVIGLGFVASAILWPHQYTTSTSTASRAQFVPIAGRDTLGLSFGSTF